MTMVHHSVWLAVVGALLAGCAGSDTTRFYALSAEAPSGAAVSSGAAASLSAPLSVGLSPVSLPKYLDRPQLVTRPEANAVKLNEFDKWSEPLDELFRRTLAADLRHLLATDRVYLMPVRRAVPIERIVDIQINRFEAEADGAVVLAAQWQVYGKDGTELAAQRSSTVREPVVKSSSPVKLRHEAIVAAMSRAVATLAQEIAAALAATPGVRADGG